MVASSPISLWFTLGSTCQDKELQEGRLAPPDLPNFEDLVAPVPVSEKKEQLHKRFRMHKTWVGSVQGKGLDYHDFVGIIVLLIVNSTISFIEENNVGNATAALMAQLAPQAKEDESLLEAFHKSWVNGALDRAANRCSGTYTIALHHLSSFIFSHDNGEKLSLRNKFIKSLLRDYSRKQQHEMMMVDLIRYNYPPNTQMSCENKELYLQSILSKRFQILTEACEGNSSLLHIVERLKSACSRLT